MIQIVCSHHYSFAAAKVGQSLQVEITIDHYSAIPYLHMICDGQQIGVLDIDAIKLRESQCPTCHRPWKDPK